MGRLSEGLHVAAEPGLIELEAPELVGRLLLAIVAAAPAELSVEPAFALRRRDGRRPSAMVWAVIGRPAAPVFDALMSAATARAAAVRIATSPWALAAHADPAALGLAFTTAADEAESLVAAYCKEHDLG